MAKTTYNGFDDMEDVATLKPDEEARAEPSVSDRGADQPSAAEVAGRRGTAGPDTADEASPQPYKVDRGWMAKLASPATRSRWAEQDARIAHTNEQTAALRRQNDGARRADAAMGELSALVTKYDRPAEGAGPEQVAGPDMPDEAAKDPNERVGYGIYRNPGLLKNREFLDEAGRIFLKHKLPGGMAWLKDADQAGKENLGESLKLAIGGDLAGAEKAFNAGGQMKLKPGTLAWADEKQTTLTGVKEDGSTFTVKPHEMLRVMVSPEEYLKRSQGDYYAGRNEANVTGRTISADARVDAADVSGASREEAARIRAGGLPRPGGGTRSPSTGGSGRSSSNPNSPYGGDKGQQKWTSDFETKFLPKRDAKDENGQVRRDKNGQAVQEVDDELAPTVRDLARTNAAILNTAGVHPQEAAQVFTQFAGAFKGGDRAKAFKTLDAKGRIAVADNEDGNPVKAVGIMGQYKDASGNMRPLYFTLPEKMSDELVAQEAQNRIDKENTYRDERGWSPRSAPARTEAAIAAARGTQQRGSAMPHQKFLPEPRLPGRG